MGEIIKRISGKTVGNFFREEIAEPLDIDFHIGLQDEHHSRVAEIHQAVESNPEDLFELEEGSVMQKVMTNGIITAPDANTPNGVELKSLQQEAMEMGDPLLNLWL